VDEEGEGEVGEEEEEDVEAQWAVAALVVVVVGSVADAVVVSVVAMVHHEAAEGESSSTIAKTNVTNAWTGSIVVVDEVAAVATSGPTRTSKTLSLASSTHISTLHHELRALDIRGSYRKVIH
jgi:hypothetical protein